MIFRDGYVIPPLIKVDTIIHAPEEALKIWSECATSIVVMRINEYIAEKENSDNPDDKCAAGRLKTIFKHINERNTYLESNTIREIVNDLWGITYGHVNATVDIEKLKGWHFVIHEILTEENAVATKTLITSDVHHDILKRLSEYYRNNSWKMSTEENMATADLIGMVSENPTIFKTAPFQSESRTLLYGLLKRREFLETIYDGLEFLIDKKEKGINPRTWRLL